MGLRGPNGSAIALLERFLSPIAIPRAVAINAETAGEVEPYIAEWARLQTLVHIHPCTRWDGVVDTELRPMLMNNVFRDALAQ